MLVQSFSLTRSTQGDAFILHNMPSPMRSHLTGTMYPFYRRFNAFLAATVSFSRGESMLDSCNVCHLGKRSIVMLASAKLVLLLLR